MFQFPRGKSDSLTFSRTKATAKKVLTGRCRYISEGITYTSVKIIAIVLSHSVNATDVV